MVAVSDSDDAFSAPDPQPQEQQELPNAFDPQQQDDQDDEDQEDQEFGDDADHLTRGTDEFPVNYDQTAEIFSKKYWQRDQVKIAAEIDQRRKRIAKYQNRRERVMKWQSKTSRSPFNVNLVADNERLDEEHKIREFEEFRRQKVLEKKTREAKNDVILKALSESSDLDLLRREKRAILDEEKRLRALMDLEKTNSHRKIDLIAAKHAEKQRKQEKEEFRRRQRREEIEYRQNKYRELLREKLAIDEQAAATDRSTSDLALARK